MRMWMNEFGCSARLVNKSLSMTLFPNNCKAQCIFSISINEVIMVILDSLFFFTKRFRTHKKAQKTLKAQKAPKARKATKTLRQKGKILTRK